MQTVKVTASITKQNISRHDLHMLCLALIKQVMSTPLVKETIYVPQLSEQGQGQKNTGVEAQQRCLINA